MVSVIVDTSALFALLDRRDAHHASAVAFWTDPDDEDLVTHAYVVVESVALVRSRLGVAAVVALVDDLLPAIRVEMVDRPLHEASLADLRRIGGGTSLVDRVTLYSSILNEGLEGLKSVAQLANGAAAAAVMQDFAAAGIAVSA